VPNDEGITKCENAALNETDDLMLILQQPNLSDEEMKRGPAQLERIDCNRYGDPRRNLDRKKEGRH